ncbi:5-formyltetrahydrofolate cyclo-ligase [Candidatus Bathyarchaeota archaeon]|nr:5-formyltetrahydrofolate cyclo-ligase [Candidatus Bathyarchaeota archaeon]
MAESDITHRLKESIRRRVWNLMEAQAAARPPRPVHGRIPNFKGAERAAEHLQELEEFKTAKIVKVNPDSPQRPVREAVLNSGKTLLVPTPRLRGGFILIDPESMRESDYCFAATIRGMFEYGSRVDLTSLPRPDMLVMGSVAVSCDGSRLGKGGGYSELEYAILSELGLVSDKTPISTTVHEIQVVDYVPMESHDLRVDIIATPEGTLRTNIVRGQAGRLIWNLVTERMISEIPVLRQLR